MSTCCRLCLSTQGKLILIFSEDPSNLTSSSAGLIFFTTGIKVSSNDGLPRHICNKCLELMYGYCNFKKQSTENNRKLQESIKRQKPKENSLVQVKRKYTSLYRNRPPTSKQLPVETIKPLSQKPLPTGIKPVPAANSRILIKSIVSLKPHQAEDVPKQSLESFMENYRPVPDSCRDPLDLNEETYEDTKCNILGLIEVKNLPVLPHDQPQPEPQPSIPEQLPHQQPKPLIAKREVVEDVPTFTLPNDADVSDYLEITMDGIETKVSIDTLASGESSQISKRSISKPAIVTPPKPSPNRFANSDSPSKILANNIVRKYNSIAGKQAETPSDEQTVDAVTVGETQDCSEKDNCFLTKFEREWYDRRKQFQEKERKMAKVRNEKKGNKLPSKRKVSPVVVTSDKSSETVIKNNNDDPKNLAVDGTVKRTRMSTRPISNKNKQIFHSKMMQVPTSSIVKGVGLLTRNSQIVCADKIGTKQAPQKGVGSPMTEDRNVTLLENDGRLVLVRSSDLKKALLKPRKQKLYTVKKKMYTCAECDFACAEYLSLVEHIHVHDAVKAFYCKVRRCDRSFSSQELLDAHTELDDHTPELVLCYKCGARPKDFADHMRSHQRKEEGKKYACHNCDKKYYTKFELTNHVRAKHLPGPGGVKEVFVCKICNTTLGSKESLRTHHRRLHKPQLNKAVCQICSKAFCRKDGLARHMRSHTGETPFVCKYNCGKSFTMMWNQVQHERLHTGEKPYKCIAPGCEEAFRHNVTRKVHHKKCHKDVPLVEPGPTKFHRPKKDGETE